MSFKDIQQRLIFILFGIITFAVVGVVATIFIFIISRGLNKMSLEFLTTAPTNGMMDGGILPAILGTCILIAGTCVIAFPIGILSGIFMNEYARDNWVKKIVSMMTNNLAGIPSIVFGLFGLALFVNFFGFGISILSGCLTLAVMILPLIIRTTEESLKLVDNTHRLSSYALGASKIQTIFKVVLPVAMPNIITGLILGIGRIAGETAPIIFTAVAYYLPSTSFSLDSPVMALPYHLYVMATSGIDLNASRDIAFGTALTLLMIVLVLNLAAGGVRILLTKRTS